MSAFIQFCGTPSGSGAMKTSSRTENLAPPSVGGQRPTGDTANQAGIATRMCVATTVSHKWRPPSRKRPSYGQSRVYIKYPSCKKRRRMCVNPPICYGRPTVFALWQIFSDPLEFAPQSFNDFELTGDQLPDMLYDYAGYY